MATRARSARTDKGAGGSTATVEECVRIEGGKSLEQNIDFLERVMDALPALHKVESRFLSHLRLLQLIEELAKELGGDANDVYEQLGIRPMGPDDLLKEARLKGEIRRRIFQEEMWSSKTIASFVESRSANPRQYANDNRRRGRLIGLPHKNRYLYPTFQFSRAEGRIDPLVSDANRKLGAAKDPWGVADWWLSPNVFTESKPPKDLLFTPEGRDKIVEAVEATSEIIY